MAAEEVKKEQAKTQGAATAPEKKSNCLACGKPIGELKRYYRHGEFYCNKKCWRNYLKKSKEEKK